MATPIGKAIRKHRIGCGLTQKELAEKMNVSEKTIRGWELEKQQPASESIITLAEIFKISPLSLYKTNIGEPEGCIHALFRMEEEYNLHPEFTKDGLLLKFPDEKHTPSSKLKRLVKTWCKARESLDKKLTSKGKYRLWKERFPDYADISPSSGKPVIHSTPIGQSVSAVKKHNKKHNYKKQE